MRTHNPAGSRKLDPPGFFLPMVSSGPPSFICESASCFFSKQSFCARCSWSLRISARRFVSRWRASYRWMRTFSPRSWRPAAWIAVPPELSPRRGAPRRGRSPLPVSGFWHCPGRVSSCAFSPAQTLPLEWWPLFLRVCGLARASSSLQLAYAFTPPFSPPLLQAGNPRVFASAVLR